MKLKYIGILLIFIAISCKKSTDKQTVIRISEEKRALSIHYEDTPEGESKTVSSPYTKYEQALLDKGLKDVQQLDASIKVELKYATEDNFMDRVLYDSLFHAFLQEEAAVKLANAQKKLKEKDSTLSLLIYDAVRPNSIQYKMWDMVKNTPKKIYVAEPGMGSLHNFGGAVDLTIVKDGVPLDMGTVYDFFGKKAQPRYNKFFLDRKELSPEQVQNRELLRAIMRSAGFIPINSEWWHFNAFSITYARKTYKIVE